MGRYTKVSSVADFHAHPCRTGVPPVIERPPLAGETPALHSRSPKAIGFRERALRGLTAFAWRVEPCFRGSMAGRHRNANSVSGITLLEIVAAIAIALTLGAILLPAVLAVDPQKEKIACINNLKQLRIAFSDYAESGWPQLPPSIPLGSTQEQEWWLEMSQRELGLTKATWQCPTLLRMLKKIPENQRPKIHYLPTPFSGDPNRANMWSKMPWFIEIGNAHRGGNLMVRAVGDVEPVSR